MGSHGSKTWERALGGPDSEYVNEIQSAAAAEYDDPKKMTCDELLIDGYIRTIQEWEVLNHIIPKGINLICFEYYHIPGPYIKPSVSTSSSSKRKKSNITTIGDKVRVKDIGTGMVKFIGEIDNKIGIYYGVELVHKKHGVGLTDGSLNDRYYFRTKGNKKGIFVKNDKIINIDIDENNLRITVGDIVTIPKFNCDGIVRFIGCTEFKKGIIWYGIQLEKPKGKNNGTINCHKYFVSPDNYGIFVQSKSIKIIDMKEINLSKQKELMKLSKAELIKKCKKLKIKNYNQVNSKLDLVQQIINCNKEIKIKNKKKAFKAK